MTEYRPESLTETALGARKLQRNIVLFVSSIVTAIAAVLVAHGLLMALSQLVIV